MATQSAIKEHTGLMISEPKKYNVLMLNDDFTTMEFVVEVLEQIFHKSAQEAEQLMLTVHHKGKAVVASYPYDIAVTKVRAAMARAKAAGFPFRVMIEEG